MTKTPKATRTEWLRRAREALGGAVTSFVLPESHAIVLSHGLGSRVVDVDGRDYIDYVLGSGPLILGHAHPAIVEAVSRQAALGSTFYTLTPAAIELAQEIIRAVPCAEQIKFVSTGTEATFHALRIARAYTGRTKILKFEGAFHGVHDYALISAFPAVPSDLPKGQPDSAGIPPQVAETVLVSRWNDLDVTRALIEQHAEELAAVICEPLQRALPPAPGFLNGLRELTERYGILLIFDEVVTGFRLAYGGAQERYGVVPDLATFGKALSGGYPLAAIAGRREIMALTDPTRRSRGEPVAHLSGTLNGNPLAAAAGLATLHVLRQPGVYDYLYRISEQLRTGLRELAAARGIPLQVIGEGAVLQIVFAEEEPRDYAALLRADRERAVRFGLACLERGLFVNPGEKLYLSLAHSEADIARTLEIFSAALDTVLSDANATASD
ncbi:MAG: aspartate aminotransferase family protein [Thermomicrobium sp.]|nr:aspartate aminotransferase family protein [Thermomicrobium sp.]